MCPKDRMHHLLFDVLKRLPFEQVAVWVRRFKGKRNSDARIHCRNLAVENPTWVFVLEKSPAFPRITSKFSLFLYP